jgi:phosphoribosylformylglycinamidine cyclo-ligase
VVSDPETPKSYKEAGVDVALGNELSARAGTVARATFGAFIDVNASVPLVDVEALGIQAPQLMLASDGVGTKLKLAFESGRHDTVGIDAVAMCVNDIARRGARPVALTSYFATSKLAPEVQEAVIDGVCKGCIVARCALIGGETAELPDFYAPGEYDLAATRWAWWRGVT